MSLLSPTEMFDLVVRGVLVNALGCLGIAFNIMIIIVLRKPEFTKVSLNLIIICKFTDRIIVPYLPWLAAPVGHL